MAETEPDLETETETEPETETEAPTPGIVLLLWMTGKVYIQLGTSTLASRSNTGFIAYMVSVISSSRLGVLPHSEIFTISLIVMFTILHMKPHSISRLLSLSFFT